MASESSSDEENLETFSEIVESATLGLQSTKNDRVSSQNSCSATARKQSLRHWRDDEERAHSTLSILTPEFRKHMAKKLSAHLDSCIECKEVRSPVQVKKSHRSSEDNLGVFLLSASKESIQAVENNIVLRTVQKQMRLSSTSSDSSDDDERCRLTEAAVSGYSIIENGDLNAREEVNKSDEREQSQSITKGKNKKQEERKKKKKKKKKERDKELNDEKNEKEKKRKKKHKRAKMENIT